MNDRTVTRAARHGTRTTPIEQPAKPKQIRGNVALAADELALAMEMARTARTEDQIRRYAQRKKATSCKQQP